ncbi:condensation domain-containing protein [Streptomyces sp. NPDC088350]|uniref:AMP-binding enzyme n=1 Tax=Streptomyces sp. NPDC088350 TaxID=3365854 RepID=UPI00382C446D
MPYNNVQVMSDSDGDPSTGGHSRTVAASSARRRMYFSWILRSDDTADIGKAVPSVGGGLSVDRLERACMVLYRRRGAFRTTCLERNGEVLQVVRDADACRVGTGVVEAEGVSSAERRDRADAEAARRVKVRGVRVEPGEVEAALLGHPDVARAAVVATGEGTRKAKSAAFLVPADEGGDATTTAGVRVFLRDRLPSAMLPDRVELLDAFPITANGKVDRRALAERMASSDQPAVVKPLGAGLSSAAPAVASPADTRGRQLCEIGADVLDLPEAGLDDDFFALGGTSLRDIAAQLGAAESSARPVLRCGGTS